MKYVSVLAMMNFPLLVQAYIICYCDVAYMCCAFRFKVLIGFLYLMSLFFQNKVNGLTFLPVAESFLFFLQSVGYRKFQLRLREATEQRTTVHSS